MENPFSSVPRHTASYCCSCQNCLNDPPFPVPPFFRRYSSIFSNSFSCFNRAFSIRKASSRLRGICPASLPVPRCSVPGTFSPSHAESGFPPDVPAPHPQTAARHLDSQHRLQPFLHHMVFSHDRTSRLLSGISLMIRLYPVQYQVPGTKSILFHNGYGAALTGQVFFHRLALHFLAVPPHGLIPVLLQC